MKIGVLALQGDVEEHIAILRALNVNTVEVRAVDDLVVDGLIIPGGESTTMGKLLHSTDLDAAIKKRVQEGMPVFGTCAGLIVMAQHIEESTQPVLSLIDISVQRNKYGRQIDSFETVIKTDIVPKPLSVVFIRAPVVSGVGEQVTVLATYEGTPVLLRQQNVLGASFHPEITGETAVHRYFVEMVKQSKKNFS